MCCQKKIVGWWILAVFCCLPAICLRAQATAAAGHSSEPDISIIARSWNIRDGLKASNIDVILHDSRGLLWMETNLGLMTFDGYRFREFRMAGGQQQSGKIVSMAEDVNGNIWLMRNDYDAVTIDVLEPATRRIQPLHAYLSLPKPIRIKLHGRQLVLYNIEQQIWIGSVYQGFLYDGQWRQVFRRNSNLPAVGTWYPAKNGFWLKGPESLRFTDAQGNEYDAVANTRSSLIKGEDIFIWPDKDKNLWMAVRQGSQQPWAYTRFSVHNGRILPTAAATPTFSWIGQSIAARTSTRFLNQSLLLYDKTDSLHILHPHVNEFINLRRHYPDIYTYNNFYLDRDGGLWCVNQFGLLRLTFKKKQPFKTLLVDAYRPYSMRGLAIHGQTLYANNYNGAVQIHLPTSQIKPFLYEGDKLGLALLADEKGIWAGSHSMYLLHLQFDGRQNQYLVSASAYSQTLSLRTSAAGNILAGTGANLFIINPVSQQIRKSNAKDLSVYCLHENAAGIWAGTQKGLYLFDANGRQLAQQLAPDSSLRYEFISHIYEDEQGLFWLSTRGGGLLCWNPASGKTRQYTTRQGLSNNTLHAVYPDGRGYLWLPSDFGLMRFHTATGTVRTFFKEDGIADNEFNMLSHCRAPDGTLFFGGINGITFFHPWQIPPEAKRDQPLRLVEAKTFDIKTGLFAFQCQHARQPAKLRLRPSDAYLDLSFSPMLFEEPGLFSYEWKIEGLHQNWIQQSSPLIRLSKLPYGKQRLYVKFRRQGNLPSEQLLEIPIDVLRPFYLSFPFILLVIGLIVAGALLLSYWRNRQLIEANQLLEAEVAARTRQINQDKEIISQQASDLRALDEMKSRFFTNITHELRTPLTLIIGPVEQMLRHTLRPEKTTDYLLTIQRNAGKLLTLIEELLDLSKIESNKLSVDEKPVHLYLFLNRIVQSFRPLTEYHGLLLQFDYRCPKDLFILMDIPKWEKILHNLLGNAVKFTPPGGSVSLAARFEGSQLVLTVADTGKGIAPEDLPHIFDRYYQSKLLQSNIQGGTGIGLALSKEYARLLGADIRVDSRPGAGSTFSVIFSPHVVPEAIYPITSPQLPQLPSLQRSLRSDFSDRRHTLLVVEDDQDMLDYILSLLQDDYNLLTATHGEMALQLLSTASIDLVLSDVMMPQMDGFQLLEEGKRRYNDLPFILLTARIETADRLRALQLGVDDYLTKPFVEDELKARLRNLLARYDERRKARTEALSSGNVPDTLSPLADQSFDRKWLTDLEEIVQCNISNPDFGVVNMAEQMNISERSLYYKIKSYTGMTPNQYLLEARLMKARQLMENKSYSTVSEVCFAVGFSSLKYFSKVIKDRFGKTPSAFLR